VDNEIMINQLDLHGTKHEDVDRVVENFVLMNPPPLRIITGNSNKMVELVVKVLNRHDIEYEQFKPTQITILN
tara:strand:+ start:155 stop:373 length:219 start_codon:yes stop_codon:yes gene_type:complete